MRILILLVMMAISTLAADELPAIGSWTDTEMKRCIENTPVILFPQSENKRIFKGLWINGVRFINQSTLDKISLNDPLNRNDTQLKTFLKVNIVENIFNNQKK